MEKLPNFCLFCYKKVVNSNTTCDSSLNINKFFKFVNQFSLQKKVNPLINLFYGEEILESCNKCKGIINNFCATYNKLELIQMKLDFILEKLVGNINYANKVPARWIHVNQVLETTLDFDKKNETQRRIRKFRHNVIQAGHQRKLRPQPRILLSRTKCINELVKPNMESVQDNSYPKNDEHPSKAHVQSSVRQHHSYSTRIKSAAKMTNVKEIASEGDQEFETEEMPANLSKYKENMIETTTFPMDDDGTEYDDMPELEDYSGAMNDDTVEGIDTTTENDHVDTSNKMTMESTPMFGDPLIEVKEEHLSVIRNGDLDLTSESIEAEVNKTENIGGRRAFKSKGGRPRTAESISRKVKQTCGECGKKLSSKASLITHLEYHKDPKDWKFGCEVCGKKFAREQALNEHMKKHTKERPFVCRICGEKYAYNISLKKHLNDKHGNGKEKESEIFYGPRTLKSKGGRPRTAQSLAARKLCKKGFTCSECGKKLSSKSVLNIHMEFHKDPKDWQYGCEECGKKFARRQALKEHYKRHTREQPFGCRYCVEKYRHKRSLINHLNKVHGKEEGVEEEIYKWSNNLLTESAPAFTKTIRTNDKLNRYSLRKSRSKNVKSMETGNCEPMTENKSSGKCEEKEFMENINASTNLGSAKNDLEESEEIGVDKNADKKDETSIEVEEIIEAIAKTDNQDTFVKDSADSNLWTRKGTCFGDGTLVHFEDLD